MSTFSGQPIRQRPDELRALIELLKREGVRTYIEVGCCYGDTFHDVVKALPAGSRATAVDMVYAAWGKRDSEVCLRRAVSDLQRRGYDARVIFGDSKSADVQRLAAARGPYDAVFIDGDHSYPGVSADWRSYGPMGRIIVFHDIDGGGRSRNMEIEVPRLWAELKQTHRHVEIHGQERGMGIGVLWRA